MYSNCSMFSSSCKACLAPVKIYTHTHTHTHTHTCEVAVDAHGVIPSAKLKCLEKCFEQLCESWCIINSHKIGNGKLL